MSNTQMITKQQTATKQLERFKRVSMLRALMEKEENREASFADLAGQMREHPWVQSRWPTYSHSTAHRDFSKSMDLIKDDVHELSSLYFSRQVNILDEVIDELKDLSLDPNVDTGLRISAANSLRGYLDTSIKIFGNYMPKQMNLTRTTFEFTIDDFKKLKAEASAQVEVVDSYVVDDDEEDGN